MSTLTEPSLFDAIAALVPEEMRERYYARMAHLQSLHPNDEILCVCEAMGFLALIVRATPALVANEREQLGALLQSAATSITKLQTSIDHLAPDVAQAVNVDAIAMRVGEGIRQRLQNTGLMDVSNALKSSSNALHSALKEFNFVTHDLVDPKGGMLGKIDRGVKHFEGTLHSAIDRLDFHAKSLDRKASQHNMYLMLFGYAVFLVFGAVIGFFVARVFR